MVFKRYREVLASAAHILKKKKKVLGSQKMWEVFMLLLLLLSRCSRVRLCATPWQPPGSPVPGVLQARALEWVAISFSNA